MFRPGKLLGRDASNRFDLLVGDRNSLASSTHDSKNTLYVIDPKSLFPIRDHPHEDVTTKKGQLYGFFTVAPPMHFTHHRKKCG
jgi:hypothetical protein